jgi:rRNA processing protein Krr1/Pno1
METRVSVTIPLERLGVLIGTDGSTKSKIEEYKERNRPPTPRENDQA